MPNGIFPVTSPGPGLGTRLKSWVRRDRLDDELARGVEPTRSPELELRADRLTSVAERAGLAEGLEHAVHQARGKPAPFTVALPLRRAEVRRIADDLLVLAGRLRADEPIDVRGAAMVSRLLHDGASPLYDPAAGISLEHAVRSARLALDPPGLTHEAPAIAA